MRWIYLSPHLDDAVLSAGGLIHEQARAGLPVEVWTVLSGFPPGDELSSFAQEMHALWGFSSAEETVQERRQEDDRAAALLGATTLHFDFLDALYRRGPEGEWLYPQDVSVEPQAADASLPAVIAEAVSLRLLPDDILVCQLGIGGHVDHAIVREAAGLLGRPLWYDADIPYLFDHPEELSPTTAGMSEMLHPVSEAGLEAWQQGIMVYASQISTVFDDPAAMPGLLRQYWEPGLGISLWRTDCPGLASQPKS
jgi:LmbE family N-acetylglucosaminyl deacetylase